MLTSISAFLAWFDSVHRRAVRDIAALPPAADGWTPSQGEGEKAWSINQIVGHLAWARLYFAGAYRGEGWVSPYAPDVSRRELWVPVLEESAARFRELLADTPDEWLNRRIPMINSEGTLSGWRILMMGVEHDIHHRSQIDTYSGLNGWDPPQIYGMRAEQVNALRDDQIAKRDTR